MPSRRFSARIGCAGVLRGSIRALKGRLGSRRVLKDRTALQRTDQGPEPRDLIRERGGAGGEDEKPEEGKDRRPGRNGRVADY
jgi:hypothetical protein